MGKLWPCLDNRCGWCCNPVKVYFWTAVPIINWQYIWEKINEIWLPKKYIDTVKLEIYKCLWYDSESKLCKFYDDRPDICRNTSCIDNIHEDVVTQYEKVISQEFLKIKFK